MSGACCSPSAGREPVDLSTPAPRAAGHLDLVEVPGGTFAMGADDPLSYPADGEGPVREVHVDAFRIAPTTVTVDEFAAFIAATEHVTDAETFGDSLVFSGLVAGEARPRGAVAGTPWWHVVPGADWRRPGGPGSDATGDHPVTHVSHRDATAYAAWVGGRLPTETEWERAARGDLAQQPFPWGSEREPDGVPLMKTFAGSFPDGPTEPVGPVAVRSFAPNAFGLHETTGNVWEWTASPWSAHDPRPVLRGGSYLCHDSYCRRYRTSARIANTPDTSLGHTGFRVAG